MFWNKKKSENCEKKNTLIRALDKIMMGIVIGGAIGSVIGMAVAPKKGKETRELLKKKIMERNARDIGESHGGEMRQIPHEEMQSEIKKA
ncbi:YtxH domain-containing protein [Candidatus Peregrinibacteria bacterium]|nr:YtxH domain-containing protein [Candidatus Peregrinibacteria bacterium]